jgi:hypothetical protein
MNLFNIFIEEKILSFYNSYLDPRLILIIDNIKIYYNKILLIIIFYFGLINNIEID